ncbi:MAG: DUF4393 domain-containing protein [Actinomycetota bacterium]|nr:DUF4393 domain-containing protein [Actinomycetota bacterium]
MSELSPRPRSDSQDEEIQRAEARPRFGLPGLSGLADGLLSVSPGRVARALPDVAKVAGEVLWRTNRWTINASLHVGDMVIRGAVSGQSAQVLVEQISAEAKQSLREALGLTEAPDPMPKALRERIGLNGSADTGPKISLADRMNALLDASADLTYPDSGHPAYVQLLSELSPDEARILRLFAQRGAQPSVDVRTRRPFGVGSVLIAPGITMIGRYAGCRHTERVPAYLNNLFRLGMVWFSHETLPDQSLYDVLEAQEEVEEAMAKAGRGVTIRRSIELTAFGRNLCAMTGLLPPSDTTARPTEYETTHLPPPDPR